MGYRVAGEIFLHEVSQILVGLRYALVFGALAVLLTLTAFPAAARYEIERQEREEVIRSFHLSLQDLTIGELTDRRIPAIKPPWPLLFAIEGGQTTFPNRYDQELSTLRAPRLERAAVADVRLPTVPPFDWMLVVRVALSLASFVLCHDALATEREARRSRLVWSHPVTRGNLLLGKLLAYQACLSLPVVLGAAASTFLFTSRTGVSLTPVAAKLACLLALAFWATAIYVLIALWFASYIREAATCLTVLLFAWVASVVVVPAVADIAARRFLPVASEVAVEKRLDQIYDVIHGDLAGRSGRWRGREQGAVDDFASERVSASAENRTFSTQERYKRQVLQDQLEQARLARDLASVSPVYLIQNVAERLSGTGVWRERAFLEQVRDYRGRLAATIRALDLSDPESPHIFFVSDYLSQNPLPVDRIKPFVFHERTLGEGIAASWCTLLALLAETWLLAWATRRAFASRAVG